MLVIRLSDQISQREREVGSETERQRDRRREGKDGRWGAEQEWGGGRGRGKERREATFK